MDFLHSHNVCHRDLKSANVLFDRKLHVKLCDFAFSKFRQVQEEAEGDGGDACISSTRAGTLNSWALAEPMYLNPKP